MIFCRQVAEALADHRYWELPWHRRMGLHIHVFLCFVCGRYHRQVMFMQKAAHVYVEHELIDPPADDMRLSAEAHDRIKKSILTRGV